jgi:hypothetical protein
MRLVHPITSQPLAVKLPSRPVRRMPAPSRLPTVHATRPTALRRILRALGIGR